MNEDDKITVSLVGDLLITRRMPTLISKEQQEMI